jgi:hypothetical protein
MRSFQEIYDTASSRHAEEWNTFAPARITELIYQEMRRLDAKAVRTARQVNAPDNSKAVNVSERKADKTAARQD